jgi:hypothetical protein
MPVRQLGKGNVFSTSGEAFEQVGISGCAHHARAASSVKIGQHACDSTSAHSLSLTVST